MTRVDIESSPSCLYEMKELFLSRVRMKEMIEFFSFDGVLSPVKSNLVSLS